MESQSGLFLMLTLIAALGRFAAFAIDPKILGAKSGSHSVELIGVDAADADPRPGFGLLSIHVLRKYIILNFGTRYFSFAKFWRVAAMSAFIVLGVFVTSHAISDTAWKMPSDTASAHNWPWQLRIGGIVGCLFALVMANTIADTIAIAVVRHLIEPCGKLPLDNDARRKLALRAAFLPIYALAIYLLFFTTMNFAFSAIIAIRGVMAGYPLLGSLDQFIAVQTQIFVNESVPRLTDPIGRGGSIMVGNSNLLYFCLTPLLPAGLLAITFLTGLILQGIDRISGGQVSAALANSAETQRSPLLAIGVILTVLGGVAALGLAFL